ncbi:hypothetical protein BMS3Abin15_00464 [bacterium BMS3Abin15]|nr:hypothetical protein BMS3Abin15_00464 [bacterium BMS3Abin15]
MANKPEDIAREEIESRLKQKIEKTKLFTIRWSVS